jgi:hypothetical protein
MNGFKKANSLQLYKVKILGWTAVTNGTAALISFANSYALNYPTYYTNSSATFAQLPNYSTTYTRAFAFFNEYRVKRIIVRFEPNVVDTSVSSADIPQSVYMERDLVDGSLLNDTQALELGKVPKPFASGHTVSLSMINRSNANKLWFSTIAAPPPLSAPATNFATVIPDSYGSVKLYFPVVPIMVSIGRVYVEWDIEFRGVKV